MGQTPKSKPVFFYALNTNSFYYDKKSSNTKIVFQVLNFSNFILFKDRSRSAEKSMISYFETLVILHLTKKNLYPFFQEFKKIIFSIFI